MIIRFKTSNVNQTSEINNQNQTSQKTKIHSRREIDKKDKNSQICKQEPKNLKQKRNVGKLTLKIK
jgi:hypothetical protein